MKEGIRQRKKRCPVCKKEYAEKDNYCGDDGSRLEQDLSIDLTLPTGVTGSA